MEGTAIGRDATSVMFKRAAGQHVFCAPAVEACAGEESRWRIFGKGSGLAGGLGLDVFRPEALASVLVIESSGNVE